MLGYICSLCNDFGSCLKIGQHSIFVNIRKIKNNTRILDTLFIDDFRDIMVNIFIIIIIIGNLRKLNETEKT